MSKPLLNCDLVKSQAKEAFRERLKMDIYEGAGLLSLDELETIVREVSQETLSFLSSEAKPRARQTSETGEQAS